MICQKERSVKRKMMSHQRTLDQVYHGNALRSFLWRRSPSIRVGELVTAGHERDKGFKYGKMKGLKISPPQSVARIDHTSFLCAGENGEERESFFLARYPSTRLFHHPFPVLPCPPSCPLVPPSPFRPFTLSSVSVRFAQHAILQANPSAAARYTCVLSRRFAGRLGNVAFTRFSWKLC